MNDVEVKLRRALVRIEELTDDERSKFSGRIRRIAGGALEDTRRNPLRCTECNGENLTLNSRTAPPRNGGIPDGRLRIHDTHVMFYLACEECSATPRTTDSLTEAYLWLTEYSNVRVID